MSARANVDATWAGFSSSRSAGKQGLKPLCSPRLFGTTKVVPFHEDLPFTRSVPFHERTSILAGDVDVDDGVGGNALAG